MQDFFIFPLFFPADGTLVATDTLVAFWATSESTLTSGHCHKDWVLKRIQSHSHQEMGPERDFYEVRQRTKQRERQPRRVVDLTELNTWIIQLVSKARE
jgi:hypothetical protein